MSTPRKMPVLVVGGWLIMTAGLAAQEPASPRPRYLDAIERELRALRTEPLCEVESPIVGHCEFRHVTTNARTDYLVRAIYSDESDTVYLYVPEIAEAHPEDDTTPRLLRRIAELNWRLLGAKVEWNPRSGELRVSTVLHTDSNFDRRAFRTVVRALLTQVERYAPQLRRLSAQDI